MKCSFEFYVLIIPSKAHRRNNVGVPQFQFHRGLHIAAIALAFIVVRAVEFEVRFQGSL